MAWQHGRSLLALSTLVPLLVLTACGGGGSNPSYTLGGTVAGLQGVLVLQTTAGDQISVNSDGPFSFPQRVGGGSAYAVSVLTQPEDETCLVEGASGTAQSNVTSIAVTCKLNAYPVGGTASGLLHPITLQDVGDDDLTVTADGSFAFATGVQIGSPYAVTILAQVPGQFCAVTNGSGTVGNAPVTSVTLHCDPRYAIGGTISGMTVSGLVLANNGDPLTVNAGASTFQFAEVAPGSPYDVTLKTVPAGFSCAVANGSGTANADVQDVKITCTPLPYSLGGTIAGLSSKGLILANGTDRLTVALGADRFTMPRPVTYTSQYDITIVSQPDGLTCSISHASGTMPAANLTTVAVACDVEWTWKSGSQTAAPDAVFGSQGVADTANTPPGLFQASTWVDRTGKFWLFGGLAVADGTTTYYSNDLWCYDPSTASWTWVTGSGQPHPSSGTYGSLGVEAPANSPGSRGYAMSWTDGAGNLWLFGGFGYDGAAGNGILNDLWRFNPATRHWTWMGGSSAINAAGVYGTKGTAAPGNHPGARNSGVAWTDAQGIGWLFGGIGNTGQLNDLWRHDPATGMWTWMSGSNTGGASSVYGSRGVPDPANVPSGRIYAMGSSDAEGNLWLFGGDDTDQLNDLWKYNIATNQWTWVSGKNGGGGPASYGALRVDSAGSVPGARNSGLLWTGTAGDLWLFGGFGIDSAGSGGFLNDVWRFDTTSGHWVWMNGSNLSQVAGTYGTRGVPSPNNNPPVRDYAMGWKDANGRFWVLGGQVFLPGGTGGNFNDLWTF